MRKKSSSALLLRYALLASLAAFSHCVLADGLIDRRIDWNDNGVLRRYSRTDGAAADSASANVAGLSSEARLTRTFRQSGEAYFIGQGLSDSGTGSLNRFGLFGSADANKLLENERNTPGAHVGNAAALVAPPILEYARDHPAVWGLSIIPAYQVAARARLQAHWQTDMLTGAVMGASAGYLTHRDSPLFLHAMSRGVFLGVHDRF